MIETELDTKRDLESGLPKKIAAYALILVSFTSFHSFADPTYRFERTWPTLQQPWYFARASGVVVDDSGIVYILETNNSRIQKFDGNGILLSRWGSQGTADGMFQQPRGIALDRDGNILVSDTFNSRVQKFDPNGKFLGKWGKQGAGAGLFLLPKGIATGKEGAVFVVDSGNDRIQKFDSDGAFITMWGSTGASDGQFEFPDGIAVDSTGTIYVVDMGNSRIQKFDENGNFLGKWGTFGSGQGQFVIPAAITVGDTGVVCVSDHLRIQRFDPSGAFLSEFKDYVSDGYLWRISPEGLFLDKTSCLYAVQGGWVWKFVTEDRPQTRWEASGWRGGEFLNPYGITADDIGNVYVVDSGMGRIQKFDANGNFLLKWGTTGSGNGQFFLPEAAAFDSSNNLYVADTYSHRIQKFTQEGVFLGKWGSQGVGDGQFDRPTGIAVDASGNVYVADSNNDRIQKFTGDGLFIEKWGTTGSADGQLNNPTSVALDSVGHVFVSDTSNNRIQKFDEHGVYLGKWGSFGSSDGKFLYDFRITISDEDLLYAMDSQSGRVQIFDLSGTFIQKWGSYGSSTGQFSSAFGIAVAPNGDVYVADTFNHRVQKFAAIELEKDSKAVVVAGGGPYLGNNLWDSTQASANFAYRALSHQGFGKSSIYYLSSDTQLDLDENGVADDVDGEATLTNLQYALNVWAPSELNGVPTGDVVVYLVDHGGPGTLRMSGTETLDASVFASWCNTLQANIQGKLTVVYDACESGTFVSALSAPVFAGSRLVLTSTSPGEEAYFVTTGTISFSNYFWTQVFNGATVGEAFDIANAAMSQTFQFQHPLLDDNANGQGNDGGDGALAALTHIGNGTQQHWTGPVIGGVSPVQNLDGTATSTLWADPVTDADGVARVWAIVRSPNGQSASSGTPVTGMPSVDFSPVSGNRWEANYSGFTSEGTYTVLVYARDRIGNTSAPEATEVIVSNPLSRKVLIVAGGDPSSIIWPVYEKTAQWAYSGLISQGYGDETINYLSRTSTPGVDGLAALSNIEYGIRTWASTGTQDLTIYLIGPGTLSGMWLSSTEFLLWSELDAWLDELQATLPGKATVVCDTDSAGTILIALKPPAGKQRITLASSKAGKLASFYHGGSVSFSKYLWAQVANGATTAQAFGFASQAIRYATGQEASFDDNGDGVYSTKSDGFLSSTYYIGNGLLLAGDEPLIGSITGAQVLNGTSQATVAVDQVTTTGSIAEVLALVIPPGSGETVELALTDEGNGQYSLTYDHFDYSGTYTVSVTAVDAKGQTSLPAETTVVRNGGLVLPDDYEEDDTPSTASWIGVDAFPDQTHNFHVQGDEDWARFYAEDGEHITIETNNLGPQADTYLEIYLEDGMVLVDSNDDRPGGGGDYSSYYVLDVEATGSYLVRVIPSPDAIVQGYGEDSGYDLRVWRETGSETTSAINVYVQTAAFAALPTAKVELYKGLNRMTPLGGVPVNALGGYDFGGLNFATYTVKATAPGYLDSIDYNVLIGSATPVFQAITLTLSTGSIQTTLSPSGANTAGAQWRVDSGAWQNSGISVSGLNPGSYTVSFKDVSGWITPASQNVSVSAGNTTNVNATYVETGSVQVTIEPSGAVTAGAQWRVDGGAWQNSGTTVNNLAPGAHTVSFNTIAGWNTPADQNVTVVSGETAQTTGTYTLKVGAISVTLSPSGAIASGAKWRVDGGVPRNSGDTVNNLPIGDHTVSFDAIADWDTPSSKTVTVLENDTVFDSGTYVQHTGSLSITITPSGAVAAGAQWAVDGGSWQNSGATVSGLVVGNHTVSFKGIADWDAPANKSVAITHNQTANDSGTYVQHTGSLAVTITPSEAVTAGAQWRVDGDAWQNSGTTVTGLVVGNHTVSYKDVTNWTKPGDETVTVTHNQLTSESGAYVQHTGSLNVTIEPSGARAAGAQWAVDGGAFRNSGETVTGLTVGDHTVTFKGITGWDTPAEQTATIANAQTTTKTGTYVQQTGSLTVTITPSDAVTAGAKWRVDGGALQDSGATVNTLSVGTHTVSFNTVSDWVKPGDKTVTIVKNATTSESGAYTRETGSLTITITPPEAIAAGAQWRVDGGDWKNSGDTVPGLATGDHTVTFKPVDHWFAPQATTVTVTTSGASDSGQYIEAGAIQTALEPSDAVTDGAQWRVNGGDWLEHDAMVPDLAPGDYTVQFKDITDWTTPPEQTVTVLEGETLPVTGTYVQHTGSLKVTIEPAGAITAGAQWRVDGGDWKNSGDTVSGLAVGPRTVTYKDCANWTTPDSNDVAVAKDQTTNETGVYVQHTGSLTVTITPDGAIAAGAQWTVDGGAPRNSGDTVNGLAVGQHTIAFTNATNYDAPGNITTTIAKDQTTSEAGAYTQHTGSVTITIEPEGARNAGAQWAIDGGAWQNSGATVTGVAVGSRVVSFKDVTNWTKPGDQPVAVTKDQLATDSAAYTQHTGSIIVNISPAEAVTAGAQWKLDAEATWRNTGTTATGVAVGNHAISFKSVDGWVTPTVQLATVTKDQVSTNGGTYVRATIAKPTNLQASDGTFTDKVQLTWTGVAGATSYRIFRASTWDGGEATTIGTTSGTTYDDFTAAPPTTTPPPSGGCGGSGGPSETNYVLYVYWVQALGAGGIQSDWAAPNDGYRGGTAKLNDWFDASQPWVHERALPSAMLDGGTRAARPNDPLAVRMRADDAIDATSLTVTLDGVPAEEVTVEWIPVGNVANDGWTVVRHTFEWPTGVTITLTAEATNDFGEAIQSDTIIFTIVPQDTVLPEPTRMDNALGETYTTEATGPFATPVEIRIPVPQGHDPSTLNIYYYLVDGENASWHPVENVQGLMNNERQLVNNEWVLQLNHGGVFDVVSIEEQASVPSSSGVSQPTSIGSLVALLFVFVTLLSTRGGPKIFAIAVCKSLRAYKSLN